MTKSYPKDIKGDRLPAGDVEVYLNVLTRKHALGADSPMGQNVINVAVAVFLASLLAVFLSIVLS